jgi:HEAT repeat protein
VALNFETNDAGFHSLLFSRDGRLLAAAREHRIDVFEVATGKRRHEFDGHDGGGGALAFSRDGRRLVSGGIDGRVTVWDLMGTLGRPVAKLEAKDLYLLWNDLASDEAPAAIEAIGRLVARSLESTPFLRQQLTLLNDADLKRMEALVADLDSDQFRVRDRAAKELEKLGEAAAAVLKRALTGSSAQVRDTADRLLRRIGDGEDPVTAPEARRAVRAVEILERIGSAEASALLKDLRQRGSRLVLHREADAALGRLERE